MHDQRTSIRFSPTTQLTILAIMLVVTTTIACFCARNVLRVVIRWPRRLMEVTEVEIEEAAQQRDRHLGLEVFRNVENLLMTHAIFPLHWLPALPRFEPAWSPFVYVLHNLYPILERRIVAVTPVAATPAPAPPSSLPPPPQILLPPPPLTLLPPPPPTLLPPPPPIHEVVMDVAPNRTLVDSAETTIDSTPLLLSNS